MIVNTSLPVCPLPPRQNPTSFKTIVDIVTTIFSAIAIGVVIYKQHLQQEKETRALLKNIKHMTKLLKDLSEITIVLRNNGYLTTEQAVDTLKDLWLFRKL